MSKKISLFRVKYSKDGRRFLVREADLKGKRLENPLLLKKALKSKKEVLKEVVLTNGPSKEGYIGFWEWDNKNQDVPELIDAQYRYDISPIYIKNINDIHELDDLKKYIMGRINNIPKDQRVLLTIAPKKSSNERLGVLVDGDTFQYNTDRSAVLKQAVERIPYYRIEAKDIFTIKEGVRIYKNLCLENREGFLQIQDINFSKIKGAEGVIRKLIETRLSLEYSQRDQIIDETDRERLKQALEAMNSKSIYDELSETFGYSQETSELFVNSFINQMIDQLAIKTIDQKVIETVFWKSDFLVKECEKLLETKWKQEQNSRLDEIKQNYFAEVKEIESKSSLQIKEIQNEWADKITTAKAEYESQLSIVQEEYFLKKEAIIEKVAQLESQLKREKEELEFARSELNKVCCQVEEEERKVSKLEEQADFYKSLGDDTLAATEKKIIQAKNSMSEFITELFTILPISRELSQTPEKNNERIANCSELEEVKRTDELSQYSSNGLLIAEGSLEDFCPSDYEIEEHNDWIEELDLIRFNLGDSADIPFISDKFDLLLSSFLYASFITKETLFLVGPYGEEIAQAFSIALFGEPAIVIDSSVVKSQDLSIELNSLPNKVVVITNSYKSDFVERSLPFLKKSEKQIFISYPYLEDMEMESKGVFNYGLPVLTECFIENPPYDLEYLPGKRKEEFSEYVNVEAKPNDISFLNGLKLNRIVSNRLNILLSTIKMLLSSHGGSKIKQEKDIDILLGVVPLAVLTNNTQMISKENQLFEELSDEVKEVIEHLYVIY